MSSSAARRGLQFLQSAALPRSSPSFSRALPAFQSVRRATTDADSKPPPRLLNGSPQPSSSSPKAKPKTKAMLRRTNAQQSQPVRNKVEAPPRRAIAFSTAERYDLELLAQSLEGLDARMVPDEDGAVYVPLLDRDGSKEVFVFRSGSFVTWGMTEQEGERFLREVIRRGRPPAKDEKSEDVDLKDVLGTGGRLRWAAKGGEDSAGQAGWVEKGRYMEEETEQLDFVEDPSERTRLQGDLIVLGTSPPLNALSSPLPPTPQPPASPLPLIDHPASPTLLAKYSFSHALSRSAKLSALESQLARYLASVSTLPSYLAAHGRVPPEMDRKAVVSRMGELLRFRQGLNLELEEEGEDFWGAPDVFWEEEVLEDYFQQVSKALDIEPRVNAVNQKITYAADVQSTLREILAESSGHRMEIIIIVLIAVEVGIAFILHGPELWHVFFPPKEGEKKGEAKAE